MDPAANAQRRDDDEVDALGRFVDAQHGVIDAVRTELAAGRKRSHWMWFVFPQLRALGRSGTARFYGLDGLDEASRYAAHPLLGARLRECAALVLRHAGHFDVHTIFGSPDDLKLRSSMTLFARAAPGEPVFGGVLDAFYGGVADELTLRLLAQAPPTATGRQPPSATPPDEPDPLSPPEPRA